MSYRTTGAAPLRHQSMTASTQSSALQQRINEKRVELENLKQLRDLSAGLAGQMEQLEEKLSTLSNGTEGGNQSLSWMCAWIDMTTAVAAVLSNWHNVLRAIHMASTQLAGRTDQAETALPQTLVRIPVQDVQPSKDSSPTEDG